MTLEIIPSLTPQKQNGSFRVLRIVNSYWFLKVLQIGALSKRKLSTYMEPSRVSPEGFLYGLYSVHVEPVIKRKLLKFYMTYMAPTNPFHLYLDPSLKRKPCVTGFYMEPSRGSTTEGPLRLRNLLRAYLETFPKGKYLF